MSVRHIEGTERILSYCDANLTYSNYENLILYSTVIPQIELVDSVQPQ